MSPREIRIYGDPVLGTRAEEVTTFDAGLRTLAGDMLETMDNAGGVGTNGTGGMPIHSGN